MRKLISLIISASIFLQIVMPTASIVTYANTAQGNYAFKWERGGGLGGDLEPKGSVEGSKEVLVSWEANLEASPYILEYIIENPVLEGAAVVANPERVRFTFKKDTDVNATARIEILNKDGVAQTKKYRVFDFTSIGAAKEDWVDQDPGEYVDIDINSGSGYPGGRIKVGDMEMRFRWRDGKIYFQTNDIKEGYITPFTLKYGNTGTLETINVLTGLEGYAVSPIHIEKKDSGTSVFEEVIEKPIVVPGEDGAPGSKPGIKIVFKGLKQWSNTDKMFEALPEEEAQGVNATLDIADLTDVATAQLTFNMGTDKEKGSEITGLGEAGKRISYNEETRMYSIYLAKDDLGYENVVKWGKLDKSMIFKKVQLSLEKREANSEEGKPLGIFSPQPESEGRYTYLGYTIKRSSMEEAFIEVQPYNGAPNTEYTYTVNFSSDGSNWATLVEHKYMTTGQNDEKPFTIPVPFQSTSGKQYYQVRAKYNQVIMDSQVLHYKPDKDLTVPPPTPVIKSIDNIYVVPPAVLGDQPETIGFDLTWSAPKNSSQNKLLDRLLEQGNIYYELFFHEDLESVEERGTLSKVFKVSLDKDKQVQVSVPGGTAGNTAPEIGYNASKDSFTMENIVLKKPKQTGWEQIEIINPDPSKKYEEGKKYPELKVTNDMASQEVPGIYYVTMRALYATTTGAIEMGVSNKSNPKSITLSPLEEVIPVPTRIESKHLPDENDPSIVRQLFSWGNVSLDRYKKQMLEPLDLIVGGEGRGIYEIYLYQDKDIKESDLKGVKPAAENLHLSNSYKLNNQNITDLRDGKVIRLDYKGSNDGGMNNLTLDGLDKNQVYYSKIKVRLDLEDKNGKPVEETERYSLFSKEHSFTSYIEPSEPGPGERVPPVPEKLQLIDQPNNTTAKIGWEAPEYNAQEGERLYYEMLRLDTRTLAKTEDNRLLSINDLMGKDSKDEMAAWQTKGPFIEEYIKSSSQWSKAIPEQNSTKLQLEDPGLNPNQIYYYYVRTVLVVDGEALYSSWVGMPVTTDPIRKPIQLKVEDKETYAHDPKREIVISFLAPIPKGANIPTDYDFDVAVQGELDGEYKLNYSKTSMASKLNEKDIPTGYSHYVYKLNNLKPGKRYDIKVRIIDKLVNKVNDEYPKSLYSGRVTTRTHFDQEEQDKENKFEEYLKYFEDKVEALRRRPYWTLEDGANQFSIKYRTNYLLPEISGTKAYQLHVKEGVSDFTYYMPAKAIEGANLSQTSFEIKQGNITYSVRPSTITTDLEVVKAAIEDISDQYIRDYYVKFDFSQRSNTRKDLLTPEISVDIELVRLREQDALLDDDIMIALNEEIIKEQKWFIEDLEIALKKGKIQDEALESLVNKAVLAIQSSHQKDVRSILSRNTYKTHPIDGWKKSLLIMAAIDGNAIAEGYSLGYRDTPIVTFNVGGGFGIEISQRGTYGFKGQKVNMPIIPNVGGAGNLIVKYQLTDFFGLGGTIDPNSNTSKRNVLGAMARVLGAPRGADYLQYLKQRDVKGVTNLGMDQPIRKGEGTYLLMQVYEKTHNKPIGSVYIKNRNALSNIRDFNQIHQPYVLVAVDSKIITGPIRPNDLMLTKDVLQVLSNIMETTR